MSNLIYKSDVLDLLRTLYDTHTIDTDDGDSYINYEDATEGVEQLPSTESKIIRCKDCVYYNWDCIDIPYGVTKMVRWCDLHYDAGSENLVANPDDYCKWAKRRVNGTD